MKKELKYFGIIAVFALIVFSAAACKGTDGLTYTVVLMTVDQDHYGEVFDPIVFEGDKTFELLEGSRGDLIDRVNAAVNDGNFTEEKNVSGLSYDTAKDTIYDWKPQGGELESIADAAMVNELYTREFCVGVKKLDDEKLAITAAYSE